MEKFGLILRELLILVNQIIALERVQIFGFKIPNTMLIKTVNFTLFCFFQGWGKKLHR